MADTSVKDPNSSKQVESNDFIRHSLPPREMVAGFEIPDHLAFCRNPVSTCWKPLVVQND